MEVLNQSFYEMLQKLLKINKILSNTFFSYKHLKDKDRFWPRDLLEEKKSNLFTFLNRQEMCLCCE